VSDRYVVVVRNDSEELRLVGAFHDLGRAERLRDAVRAEFEEVETSASAYVMDLERRIGARELIEWAKS
jgi:hypothetical protein